MGPRSGGERSDPAVDGWLKVLVEKMNDPHDTVRESARAAIVAIGPAALPTLRQLADGPDGAKAVAARKLIGMIEQHHRGAGSVGGMPGPGGYPGGPPAGQPGLPGSSSAPMGGPGIPGGSESSVPRGPGQPNRE